MASQQDNEPKPCVKNCGFYGTPAAMNLCSVCYRDFRTKQEAAEAASAKAPSEGTSSSSGVIGGDDGALVNRCWCCKKKVGLTGETCKCGRTLCGTHLYPEMHDCTFDFKVTGCDVIAKANPVVKTDKLRWF